MTRSASHRQAARSASGFSLIEMVVVLVLVSLLAGATAPLVSRQIQSQRQRLTQERMRRVVSGMVGDPREGEHGYPSVNTQNRP